MATLDPAPTPAASPPLTAAATAGAGSPTGNPYVEPMTPQRPLSMLTTLSLAVLPPGPASSGPPSAIPAMPPPAPAARPVSFSAAAAAAAAATAAAHAAANPALTGEELLGAAAAGDLAVAPGLALLMPGLAHGERGHGSGGGGGGGGGMAPISPLTPLPPPCPGMLTPTASSHPGMAYGGTFTAHPGHTPTSGSGPVFRWPMVGVAHGNASSQSSPLAPHPDHATSPSLPAAAGAVASALAPPSAAFSGRRRNSMQGLGLVASAVGPLCAVHEADSASASPSPSRPGLDAVVPMAAPPATSAGQVLAATVAATAAMAVPSPRLSKQLFAGPCEEHARCSPAKRVALTCGPAGKSRSSPLLSGSPSRPCRDPGHHHGQGHDHGYEDMHEGQDDEVATSPVRVAMDADASPPLPLMLAMDEPTDAKNPLLI